MTIGEKIQALRNEKGLPQEELAALLGVSRQSVSKWEMGQALPQLDKMVLLSELFGVTVDELLKKDCTVKAAPPPSDGKPHYFGTDGFRGEANITLTSQQAYKVGRFLGWYFGSKLYTGGHAHHKPRIVIGKDTRRSSYMLEYSLIAGAIASGADVYMLHVTTTPSVSFVTRQDEFDCGIMITASHNPFHDNGIKVISRYGEKLDDATTLLIEAYLDGNLSLLGVHGDDLPLATGEALGLIEDYASGRNRYLGYLISLAAHSFKKLKIGLDCANGASWMLARSLFGALGAQLTVIGDSPNGININKDCGSTHIEQLCRLVKEKHLDLGFAFDGDGDRCIAVDENGDVVDGDRILYILGRRLKERDMLSGDTLVATVMSNSGLDESLRKIGVRCERTKVGDRFVYECMQEKGYALGGEQSGHIIMKKYASTGDGLLTAIMLAEEVSDRKLPLSELSKDVLLYPQFMQNIRVHSKAAALSDARVLAVRREIEGELAGQGRLLLRESGTEPLIRIMVECPKEEDCRAFAERVADAIRQGGHAL